MLVGWSRLFLKSIFKISPTFAFNNGPGFSLLYNNKFALNFSLKLNVDLLASSLYLTTLLLLKSKVLHAVNRKLYGKILRNCLLEVILSTHG